MNKSVLKKCPEYCFMSKERLLKQYLKEKELLNQLELAYDIKVQKNRIELIEIILEVQYKIRTSKEVL